MLPERPRPNEDLLEEVRRRARRRRARRNRRTFLITVAALAAILGVVIPLSLLPGGGEKVRVQAPLGGVSTTTPTTVAPKGTIGPGTTPATAPPGTSAPVHAHLLPVVVPSTSPGQAPVPTNVAPPGTPPPPPLEPPQTVNLPVVVCPIGFGVQPATTPSLPKTVAVSVSPGQASELAVYTDTQGLMKLVAPAGWQCSAQYGADGTGGVIVHPSNESVSDLGAPPAGSAVEAVIGAETSACGACAYTQACPLFAAAASTYQSQLGSPCPVTKPAAETVYQISPGIVGFEDPPGTRGDGASSGGANPANSVMTYYPNAANGSWRETCTLPADEHAICTTSLNNFIASYGTY